MDGAAHPDPSIDRGRVALLASVAVALSSAPSVEEVMEALVASLAPALCDGCEVVLAGDDGTLARVAAGPEPMSLRTRVPIPDEPDHPARQVLRTGETLLLHRSVPEEEKLFGPPDLPTSARALGLETAILAPMVAKERVVGVLVVAQGWSGRDWQEGDREFVASIATLSGLAIENLDAQRAALAASERLTASLEEQRRIARTLQASLLPPALPRIPGADLAAHYWPATDELEVGGDFYDAFPIGAGRWGLLVGDVCGKGVEAATVTSAARYTARAAAQHLSDPAVVLRWVHDAIASFDLAFCTIGYATVHEDTGAVVLSLGGHPRAIVVRADGRGELLGAHGTILGMIEPHLHTATTTLEPGDLLALYTDGITDVPRGEEMPVEELRDYLAARAGRPLDVLGTDLRRVLAARRPDGFDDDIALLLYRRVAIPDRSPQGGLRVDR